MAHYTVSHHRLSRPDSPDDHYLDRSTNKKQTLALDANVINQTTDEPIMPITKSTKHAKLIKSIINPENPFSKMTDKDMLIFNPNYHNFLKKLKAKESKTSELSRIMSQPYDASQVKLNIMPDGSFRNRKPKQEMALYAFMRTQHPQNSAGANPNGNTTS